MAGFRPSSRRHKVESISDLPLIPVMALMVVLVPMLLQTAVFEKIVSTQLNLPSSDEVSYVGAAAPTEDTVTLAVTRAGFQFISGEATIQRIGLVSGALDFKGLKTALATVKRKYPNQSAIVLLIEDGVLYDDIIHSMDECRPHFPAISFADRVQ